MSPTENLLSLKARRRAVMAKMVEGGPTAGLSGLLADIDRDIDNIAGHLRAQRRNAEQLRALRRNAQRRNADDDGLSPSDKLLRAVFGA